MVFLLERRFPLERQHLARNLLLLALSGLGMASLAIALRVALLLLAQWLLKASNPAGGAIAAGLFPELAAQLFLYALTVAGAYISRGFVQKNDRERERDRLALEKSQLEASLRRAELEVLRMRLNPHFLFNTLQNVSVLAEHDPASASQMLSRLGELLRAAFRSEFQAEVPLEAELGLTQAYLDVERIRFGDRLAVSMDIADSTVQALVPALLLQPLVENAIMHGLRTSKAGTIAIRSAIEGTQLLLVVGDDGAGPSVDDLQELKLGVGLSSTRDRLVRMYPGAYQFEIRRGDRGGMEVKLAIPFRIREAATAEKVCEQSDFANCR
jgi:sensor histidine kinase YesM